MKIAKTRGIKSVENPDKDEKVSRVVGRLSSCRNVSRWTAHAATFARDILLLPGHCVPRKLIPFHGITRNEYATRTVKLTNRLPPRSKMPRLNFLSRRIPEVEKCLDIREVETEEMWTIYSWRNIIFVSTKYQTIEILLLNYCTISKFDPREEDPPYQNLSTIDWNYPFATVIGYKTETYNRRSRRFGTLKRRNLT